MSSEAATKSGQRVRHLRFARNQIVWLDDERIGSVVVRHARGPRGGSFLLYDWQPLAACPEHLRRPITSSTRQRAIHGELLTRHHPRSP